MTQPPTLNEIADLKESGFGRPRPRHGLKLLYWFAKDYIEFHDENVIDAKSDPTQGYFGFHNFHNRRDNCDTNVCKSLLPEEGLPYYEVGNLSQTNAKSASLPDYVQKDYTSLLDDSNTDRIIISLRQDQRVEKVYVTQHEDLTTFDPTNTYRISRDLLMIIHNLSLEDFLNQAGYTVERPNTDTYESQSSAHGESEDHTVIHLDTADHQEREEKGFWETYCTIL